MVKKMTSGISPILLGPGTNLSYCLIESVGVKISSDLLVNIILDLYILFIVAIMTRAECEVIIAISYQ